MSDQVKFVGVRRERERERERKKNGGVIYMSDQVKFVGVHREREERGRGERDFFIAKFS